MWRRRGKSRDYCWHLGCILPKSASNDRAGRGMFTQQQEEVRSKEKCKEEDTPLTLTIEKGVASGQ